MTKKHVKPLAEKASSSKKAKEKDCSSVVIFPPGCDTSNKHIDPCTIQCTASCTGSCKMITITPTPPVPPLKKSKVK